jgi:hypothetical protein
MTSNYGPDSYGTTQRLQPIGDGILHDHVSEARAASKRWGDFKQILRRVPAYPNDTRTPKVIYDTTVANRKDVVSSEASSAVTTFVPQDPRPKETRRSVYGDGRKLKF